MNDVLIKAIHERHSIRKYQLKAIENELIEKLMQKIEECNNSGELHIQLVLNEPKAFNSIMAYGVFQNVTNYIIMAGKRSSNLEEKIGYYGEKIVLYAQTLGLNTCWVGLTYKKIANAFTLNKDEKVVCYIALGYGTDRYHKHKIKSIDEVSNVSDKTPEWFKKGVETALLAPTAINQQKFFFEYIHDDTMPKVKATTKFSLAGYTKTDLGITKYHFEIGVGKNKFEWIN